MSQHRRLTKTKYFYMDDELESKQKINEQLNITAKAHENLQHDF